MWSCPNTRLCALYKSILSQFSRSWKIFLKKGFDPRGRQNFFAFLLQFTWITAGCWSLLVLSLGYLLSSGFSSSPKPKSKSRILQIERLGAGNSNALGSWKKYVKTWGWILPFAPHCPSCPKFCMGLKSSLLSYSAIQPSV